MEHKDGLRSWFILLGVVFGTFFQTGIVSSLGVLLPVLQDQFESNSLMIGQAISLTLICGSILGVLGQQQCRRSGARSIVVLSGAISSVGLIIASLPLYVFSLLILGILSTSVAFVAETVLIGILPRYFAKYHTTAVSAAICGTSLGVMVMPPVTELLIQQYGWRGTFLVLGGINLHLVASGALLKPVITTELENIPLIKSTMKLSTSTPSKSTLSKFLNAIGSYLEVSLLKNFPFIVVIIVSGVYGYTFGAWGIYIVSLLQSKGLYSFQATFIATLGGMGKLFVMVLLPYLDAKFGYKCLMYISSVILFVSMVTTPLIDSYTFLAVASVLFGVGQGILSVEVYVASNKVVGEEKGVEAVAWMHLSYGVFGTVGGLLTGWLYESTMSSTASFVSIGVVSVLEAFALGAGDVYGMCQQRKDL